MSLPGLFSTVSFAHDIPPVIRQLLYHPPSMVCHSSKSLHRVASGIPAADLMCSASAANALRHKTLSAPFQHSRVDQCQIADQTMHQDLRWIQTISTKCCCTVVPAETYRLPKADKTGRETIEGVELAHEAITNSALVVNCLYSDERICKDKQNVVV